MVEDIESEWRKTPLESERLQTKVEQMTTAYIVYMYNTYLCTAAGEVSQCPDGQCSVAGEGM